ncbi:MAG: alpha/beta hydrolase [Oscillospiraceae bacterium]|jgi:pimeloyl-ACP methyl ester carboxylesterase|nr:alpha/beta hydrolase [Oscillospiraceae bacterium]
MAQFKFGKYSIYYERPNASLAGSAPSLVVLNGIFMSAASWHMFLPSFKDVDIILLDMLDQGMSQKAEEEYTQAIQAQIVAGLLDELGLARADIMGISYGGEVALQAAAEYPNRVRRLVLSNTCAYTSPWLKDIGKSWEYAFASYDGKQFFKTCIPVVYAPSFYERNIEWAMQREQMFIQYFNNQTYDAFARLTRSAETHDVRGKLGGIKVPTLIISSEHDYVTPPFQQKELRDAIKGSSWVTIPDAGHAVMYEKPNAFAALVKGFVTVDILPEM